MTLVVRLFCISGKRAHPAVCGFLSLLEGGLVQTGAPGSSSRPVSGRSFHLLPSHGAQHALDHTHATCAPTQIRQNHL